MPLPSCRWRHVVAVMALPSWFVAQHILGPADRVLDFSGSFVRRAFGLQLGIAGHFADRFFNGALDLLGRAANSVFVLCLCSGGWQRRQSSCGDQGARCAWAGPRLVQPSRKVRVQTG